MSKEQRAFASLLKRSTPDLTRPQAPVARTRKFELDMGEGSREQGFRLNGSR
jgi:hypothetical protein